MIWHQNTSKVSRRYEVNEKKTSQFKVLYNTQYLEIKII